MRRQRTPLSEVIQGFKYKHGVRNSLLHSRFEIRESLNLSIIEIGEMLRYDDYSQKAVRDALASVLSRTIAYANSFGDLDIIGEMSRRYPVEGCAYCRNPACVCEYDERRTITEQDIKKIQRKWSIEDWCRHLDKVYGKVNRDRSFVHVFNRLQNEFCKISKVEFTHTRTRSETSDNYRDELTKQFADVFAWIFAVSNMHSLNVGGIIKAWAFKKCATCDMNPCQCGPFIFEKTLS